MAASTSSLVDTFLASELSMADGRSTSAVGTIILPVAVEAPASRLEGSVLAFGVGALILPLSWEASASLLVGYFFIVEVTVILSSVL